MKTPNSPIQPMQLNPKTTAANLSKSTDNLDTRSIKSAPSVFPQTPMCVTPQSLTENPRSTSVNGSTPQANSPASRKVDEELEFHSTGSHTSQGSSLSNAHST